MKKSPLAVLILFITSLNLQSQEIASLDFVILNNNDTIYGLIDVKSGGKNFESCTFKDGSIDKIYRPNEIKGYGISVGKFYSSQVIDTSFVEVMIEGSLSLYKKGKSYFFQKDTILIEVDTKKIDVESNGKQGYVTDDRWRGKVSFLVNDCIKNTDERMASIRPGNKSFFELTRDYNTCKGGDFIEYKKKGSYAKLRFGGIAGMANTTLNLAKDGRLYSDLADSYTSSSDFSGGFVFHIIWPRLSKKIAVETGIHFTSSSFNATLSRAGGGNSVVINTSTIEYNLTSIPLIANYAVFDKNFKIFLSAGVDFGFYSGFENSVIQFIETATNGLREISSGQAFRPVGSMVGYVGGVGVSKDFKAFTAGILGRYIAAPRLNEEFDLTVSQNRVALSIFILLKGKQ